MDFLPLWMLALAGFAALLLIPAALLGGLVWLGQRLPWLRFRKSFNWLIFRWNFTIKGFRSWAIHIPPVTWNVTLGRVTLNLPGPFWREWNLKQHGQDNRQRDDDTNIDIEWSEPYHALDYADRKMYDGLGKIMAQRARINGVWIERRRKAGTATSKVLVGGGREWRLSQLEECVAAQLRLEGRRVMAHPRFQPAFEEYADEGSGN